MLTSVILVLFWITPQSPPPQAPTASQYAAADVTEKLRLLGQVSTSRAIADSRRAAVQALNNFGRVVREAIAAIHRDGG